MDAWIPCEICNTSVRFDDFEAHMRECVAHQPLQVSIFSVLMGFVVDNYELNSQITEQLGNVEVGVDSIDAVTKQATPDPGFVCAICQDGNFANECLETIPCKHVFCKHCISTWLEKSKKCPMCMAELCL